MANPDLILIPFAQDGDKNTIPLELGIGDPVYRASLKAGFPPDTRIPKDIGGEAPDGLDMNGILNVLSQAIVFMQKGNAYQFDASLAPYPIGALVRSNDNLTTFQSTIALNSNNPNSNMTGCVINMGLGLLLITSFNEYILTGPTSFTCDFIFPSLINLERVVLAILPLSIISVKL